MAGERLKFFDNKPFGIRAVGIVIHNDHLLMMRRIRYGRTYYVFPGGGIDPGETVQQAIVRELREETNQDITVDYIAYHLDYTDDSDQYFGICRYQGGGAMQLTGEELQRQSDDNHYQPLWVPVADVANLPVMPRVVRDWLLADLMAITSGEKPTRHQQAPFHKEDP